MCGRYGLTYEERVAAGEWSETHLPPSIDISAMVREQPARYNIAPPSRSSPCASTR
jgi:putative SOS response-associated peptidase YedK